MNNGAIDVRLCSEMDNGLRAMRSQEAAYHSTIADVSVHKYMGRIALERCKIGSIACVGQEIDADGATPSRDPFQKEVRSDKPRTSGDQDRVEDFRVRGLLRTVESV